jgi:hypothetical protein
MYMLPPNAPGFVKDMAVLELKGQFEMEGVNTVVRDIALRISVIELSLILVTWIYLLFC